MKKSITKFFWKYVAIFYAAICLLPYASSAQVQLSPDMQIYTQNFNTLPVSGSHVWESGTFYLPGWKLQRTNALNAFLPSTGSSNTGGLYSFGANNSTDRALGAISSANAGEFAWGLLLQNKTGATIKGLTISYTGEQWRSGSVTAGKQVTTFWHSQSASKPDFDLSPLRDIGWKNVPELDFHSLVNNSIGSALNGNQPANKTYLIATIDVDIPDGHFFMLRWKDLNDYDDDHGLAIDDVKLTWSLEERMALVPLPVELTSFKAELSSKSVKLNWATASEVKSSHFNVERSSDGIIFESVGAVPAKGYSSQVNSYSFKDEEPKTGTSYYRLKQVDLDGAFQYSGLVSIRRAGPAAFNVFPTVTSAYISGELPLSITDTYLQVYSTAGKLVLSKTIPAQQISFKLHVETLQHGNYFLVMYDEMGQRQTFQFVKQ